MNRVCWVHKEKVVVYRLIVLMIVAMNNRKAYFVKVSVFHLMMRRNSNIDECFTKTIPKMLKLRLIAIKIRMCVYINSVYILISWCKFETHYSSTFI